ncbi:MAG: endonuclease/exonuclease/phosphatase family protein [Desulfatibacillaceae bacterium]
MDDFRVMSANLRFGRAEDGPNNWEHRKHRFPMLFDRHPVDFLQVQEANFFQVDYILEHLPGYRAIGLRDPAPRYWQNNAIFHHESWEMVRYSRFFLSPTPDVPSRFPESRWPRQCTMARFERGGRSLVCINTHMDFAVSARVRGAKVILERLAEFDSDTPAVLTGDFNTVPGSPAWRYLTGEEREDGPGPELPSFRDVFGQPTGGTHHGFSGRPTTGRIDWILYRGPIECTDAAIVEDAFDGGYPSDHFPVVAGFRFVG